MSPRSGRRRSGLSFGGSTSIFKQHRQNTLARTWPTERHDQLYDQIKYNDQTSVPASPGFVPGKHATSWIKKAKTTRLSIGVKQGFGIDWREEGVQQWEMTCLQDLQTFESNPAMKSAVRTADHRKKHPTKAASRHEAKSRASSRLALDKCCRISCPSFRIHTGKVIFIIKNPRSIFLASSAVVGVDGCSSSDGTDWQHQQTSARAFPTLRKSQATSNIVIRIVRKAKTLAP